MNPGVGFLGSKAASNGRSDEHVRILHNERERIRIQFASNAPNTDNN